MNKKRPDWYLPEEVHGLLSTLFFAPAVAILAATLLSAMTTLQRIDITSLFEVGVTAGVCGVVLLFFARLPLYRRFLSFGQRELDRSHRRLYWLAYLFVLASLGIFAMVWFRVK